MGGSKGSTPQYIPTPPPAAPPVEEAETLELAEEKDIKQIQKNQRLGAKSLQIPIGDNNSSKKVGTA